MSVSDGAATLVQVGGLMSSRSRRVELWGSDKDPSVVEGNKCNLLTLEGFMFQPFISLSKSELGKSLQSAAFPKRVFKREQRNSHLREKSMAVWAGCGGSGSLRHSTQKNVQCIDTANA